MAWITKPSGTMKIPRRDQPYMDAAMKAELTRTYLPRYETKQGALLPVLHHVQHAWGWLPWQALEEVAAFLELRPSDVWDTASFYEEFYLQPKGTHVVAVCRSVSCEVCDHAKITEACKKKLNIAPGETTDDGKFTLVELECLGLCEGAPACLVDETMVMSATPQSIVQAIDEAGKNGHRPH